MGEIVKLRTNASVSDGSRERYYDDSVWECGMHLIHDGFEVTLWRLPASGWWWSLRHENATDPIERSGHAFQTRREARDAAWKALRRLATAGAKGGSR
jgi:hypothetical protein